MRNPNNYKMKKFIIFTALVWLFIFVFPIYAQTGNYGQYGPPSQTASLVIDKFVAVPKSGTKAQNYNYVDNLTAGDPTYKPGDTIYFKIKVKNPSTITLENVKIVDYVPEFVNPIDFKEKYNEKNRTITLNIGSLAPEEEKIFYLEMKAYEQKDLPADKGIFCLVNKAKASAGDISDEDIAQFCIEKQVMGAKKVPKAGAETSIFFIALTMLVSGLYLRKRVHQKSYITKRS